MLEPTMQATIQPYGGLRSTKFLSGIPTDQTSYICPFCAYTKQPISASHIFKDFYDGTWAIKSLNKQILVIPHQHYAHFFVAPKEIQLAILQHIIDIRHQFLRILNGL